MNEDRIEGTKHQIKGGLKEAAGKVTGDTSTKVSGNLEKNAGKVQRKVGQVEDEVDEDLEE